MSCRRVLPATCAAALMAAGSAASATGTPLAEDVAGFAVNGISCGVTAQTGKAPQMRAQFTQAVVDALDAAGA